jgi:predicted kinase
VTGRLSVSHYVSAAAWHRPPQRRRKSIATLHLICGLPCSGKTTLAKVLERELPALRLAPDEWIVRLFGPDIADEALDAVRDPVEAALWNLTAHVLVLGLDVILEYGFWTRAEREEYRRRAAVLGARSKLYFTDGSEEELLHRLAQRNTDRPAGTFRIEEVQLRRWMRTFEPPDADELVPREAPASAAEQ